MYPRLPCYSGFMQQQLNDITIKFFRYIDTKSSRVDKRFIDHDA